MSEKATLVKFGSKPHLLQLQEKGLLYMNNLPYFWTIEDGGLRGDQFDSVDEINRGNKGTMLLKSKDDKDVPVEINNWVIRTHPLEPEKINIFCMYALRPAFGSFPVDERNFRFGDYALVLLDPQKFINQIHVKLVEKNIMHRAGLVEYVDNNYIGEFGAFKKLEIHKYQSEWRLVSYKGPGFKREIEIGNIENISTIINSSDINKLINIDPQNNIYVMETKR